MATVPDRDGSVYVPSIQRATRPAGIGPRPVTGRWLQADFNQEWRRKSPADLARDASLFWRVPPSLQPLAYFRLVALANELADRLLVVAVVDGVDEGAA